MRLEGLKEIKKVYFIGIGGVSMSALAKFLSLKGCEVSGSDSLRSETTESLAFYGIRVFIGIEENRLELIESDAVVYTDAIKETHKELQKAKKLQKKLYSRGELLSLLCKEFSHVITVAGSHGKTTCTAIR